MMKRRGGRLSTRGHNLSENPGNEIVSSSNFLIFYIFEFLYCGVNVIPVETGANVGEPSRKNAKVGVGYGITRGGPGGRGPL